MVRVILANVPWVEGAVRAGSRWPAKYSKDLAVRYVPFPFYMGYTAALLEKTDCELLVLDCLATRMSRDEFFKKCEGFDPDLFVMETSTTSFQNDIEICKKLKEITKSKVVLAGPHVTALYKEVLQKYPFIDAIAVGEYELTIVDLVKAMKEGRKKGVDGLAFRDNNSVAFKTRPLLKNLDELPFPAWHLFPMKKYQGGDFVCGNRYPVFQLLSSRGCLFKCVFCVYPQTFELSTFRYNSPERTLSEMQFVAEKYKPKAIYFDDSTFTMKTQRIERLCNLLIENKFDTEWTCMSHAQMMTEQLIEKMAKAGCVGIKFGVESGNQKIVYQIGKGLNLEHAKKIFKACKENGIRTGATFTFGLPGETRETMKETMKFVKELDPDGAQFSIATPFPGTKFYKMAKENNWLVEHDFSLYDGNNCSVISYPHLKKEELELFAKQAGRKWTLHRLSNFSEMFEVASVAFREGGVKRLLVSGKRMMSLAFNYLLKR